MDWINSKAENYALQHSSKVDELLTEILEYTFSNHPQKQMISGPVLGQFFTMISRAMQPLRILEIGTFTGYSAICFAKGLAPGGLLYTIELRVEDAEIARGFFEKSRFTEQIRLHTGNALDVIPLLNEEWDLVFIDADKTGYSAYYDLILPKLKKNGIIIADNVLFHGDVLENTISGKNAKAMDAFNKKLLADNRVTQVLLTVRDGLLLVMKNE
jgi:predicted O-methyltransferase YrrM